MMRDEDKPFVCYTGKGTLHISPRGRAGWIAFAKVTLTLLPILAFFVALQLMLPGGWSEIILGVGFAVSSLIWSWFAVRWMKARSEIINVDELLDAKLQRDRDRRRGRP